MPTMGVKPMFLCKIVAFHGAKLALRTVYDSVKTCNTWLDIGVILCHYIDYLLVLDTHLSCAIAMPIVGLEPTTFWLQIRRSTRWAKWANIIW